jgi:hypothetical protein
MDDIVIMETLLKKILEIFKDDGFELVQDTYLNNVFETISTKILEKEYGRSTSQTINEIIISEVVNYIRKNIDYFKLNSSRYQNLEMEPQNAIGNVPVLNKKQIILHKNNTFDIQNVKSILLRNFYIKDLNYIINESNCVIKIKENISKDPSDSTKLLFSEEREIIIEHGNYTIQQLINELSLKFGKYGMSHNYFFYSDKITNKFCITTIEVPSESKISLLRTIKDECPKKFEICPKSTLLSILGFNDDQELKDSNVYISENMVDLEQRESLILNVVVNDLVIPEIIKVKDSIFNDTILTVKREYTPFIEKIENINFTLNTGKNFELMCICEIEYFEN